MAILLFGAAASVAGEPFRFPEGHYGKGAVALHQRRAGSHRQRFAGGNRLAGGGIGVETVAGLGRHFQDFLTKGASTRFLR